MVSISWNNLDKLEEQSAKEDIIIILSAGTYPMVKRDALVLTMELAC